MNILGKICRIPLRLYNVEVNFTENVPAAPTIHASTRRSLVSFRHPRAPATLVIPLIHHATPSHHPPRHSFHSNAPPQIPPTCPPSSSDPTTPPPTTTQLRHQAHRPPKAQPLQPQPQPPRSIIH